MNKPCLVASFAPHPGSPEAVHWKTYFQEMWHIHWSQASAAGDHSPWCGGQILIAARVIFSLCPICVFGLCLPEFVGGRRIWPWALQCRMWRRRCGPPEHGILCSAHFLHVMQLSTVLGIILVIVLLGIILFVAILGIILVVVIPATATNSLEEYAMELSSRIFMRSTCACTDNKGY